MKNMNFSVCVYRFAWCLVALVVDEITAKVICKALNEKNPYSDYCVMNQDMDIIYLCQATETC